MKRCMPNFACAALIASFLQSQSAAAGPVEFVANKTAKIAHKAAYRIDRHVVRPARRVVVNHTPR